METFLIRKICDYPEYIEKAAKWFNQKWKFPVEEYIKSMAKSIATKIDIPQWYFILNEDNEIIAGAGVIENDFHERKDLSPNLCGLFVEPAYRNKGIAKEILNFAREDIGAMGYKKLYLVTDHTEFYEKYDWKFICLVKDDFGDTGRMYEIELENS